MIRGWLQLSPSDTMIATDPKRRPRGGSMSKIKTTPCPTVPPRGPEVGVYRMEKIFMVRV